MYDIIGDIHGYNDYLVRLLVKLGYRNENGCYKHPQGRKILFVGDYVDRGEKVRETMQLVRTMVRHNQAVALMGNHEFNALAYNTLHNGEPLRKHSAKNYDQHRVTLEKYADYPDEWQEMMDFMYEMPLFFDNGKIRAVHASWQQSCIDYVRRNFADNKITPELLIEAHDKKSPVYDVIEILLKGKELKLPPDEPQVLNKKTRHYLRIKWWHRPNRATFYELAMRPHNGISQKLIPTEELQQIAPYMPDLPPVFFGHYWFSGKPQIIRDNLCCLDYSVAVGHKLVAYRWDGETVLSNDKLIFVE